MLTEYYAVRQRKNVLIMATKTGQDAVWNPELKEKLPELFGQFSNVLVRAHTDLTTQQGAEEIEHLAKRADVDHHRRGAQLPEPRQDAHARRTRGARGGGACTRSARARPSSC